MKPFIRTPIVNSTFFYSRVLLMALVMFLFHPFAYGKVCSTQATRTVSDEKPLLSEEVMHGKSFVISKLLVRARPEQVWQVLADYNNAARIFPMLKECELVEDRGCTKITRHVLAPSGVPGTYEYVLEVHECAPKSMEWHRVSGDFREVDGYWKLEPTDLGRHTMVTYASYVNGGFFIPQVLIKRQFRIDMPAAMLALKNKAELDNRLASRRTESIE